MKRKKTYAAALVSPLALLHTAPESLGPLYRTFVRDVRRSSRDRELPLLIRGDKAALQNLSEFGFAGTEGWGADGKYRGREPGNLIIHWPSVFRWDSTFTLDTLLRRGFESFVVLLLQFKEIFSRRSPLLGELLHRKVYDLFEATHNITPPPSHVRLSGEEDRVLRAMFHEISSGESPILPALVGSFYETFRQFQSSNVSPIKTKIRRTYLSEVPFQSHEVFSVMQTAHTFFIDSHVPGPPALVIAGVDPKKFTASRLPSPIHEIMVAYDLTTHGAGSDCGVQTLSEPGTPFLLIVNMKKFVSYRCAMGFDASAHYSDFELSFGDPARTAALASSKYSDYLSKHPALEAPAYHDLARARFFGLDHSWPADDWDYTVVVNASKLPHFLGNLRYLEEARTGVPIRYEKQAPRLKKSQILNLVYRSPYGQQVALTALRHRKKVYFSFQFGMPSHVLWGETRLYRGVSRRRPLPGVLFKREFNTFFLTPAALFRDLTLPHCHIAGFEEWLKQTASMPESQFKQLAQAQTGGPGDFIPRASLTHLNGVEFTKSEDAAICEHYHRGMEQAQWDAILTACPGRNKDAVVRRARVLALNMIKEGEYDIQKLPVQRRGGVILAAIRSARGRNGGGDASLG